MGDIHTELNYSKEARLGVKPYIYTYQRTPEEIAKSHLKADRDHSLESIVPTTIKDARFVTSSIKVMKNPLVFVILLFSNHYDYIKCYLKKGIALSTDTNLD